MEGESPLPAASSFGGRVLGALRLDSATYAETAGDGAATWQALAVSAAGALAIAIRVVVEDGRLWRISDGLVLGGAMARVALIVIVGAWVFLALYAGLLTAIATLSGTAPTPRTAFLRLLRAVGFASAPQSFQLILLAPTIGGLLGIAVTLWSFAATVVATREALDVGTGRAIAIVLGVGVLFVGLLLLATLARGT